MRRRGRTRIQWRGGDLRQRPSTDTTPTDETPIQGPPEDPQEATVVHDQIVFDRRCVGWAGCSHRSGQGSHLLGQFTHLMALGHLVEDLTRSPEPHVVLLSAGGRIPRITDADGSKTGRPMPCTVRSPRGHQEASRRPPTTGRRNRSWRRMNRGSQRMASVFPQTRWRSAGETNSTFKRTWNLLLPAAWSCDRRCPGWR